MPHNREYLTYNAAKIAAVRASRGKNEAGISQIAAKTDLGWKRTNGGVFGLC
jgi:hypothetical protein